MIFPKKEFIKILNKNYEVEKLISLGLNLEYMSVYIYFKVNKWT